VIRPVARTLAAAAALALVDVACGGAPPPPPAAIDHSEPRWQDVFDTMPELLVVLRPRALRQDKVYGPLLRRAIEVTRQQSRIVAAGGALDSLVDAGELIVGMRPDAPDRPGELVLVERSVPGDVDPAAIVDDDGRSLWAPGPAGRVRELVRERDEHGHPVGASLFELPGRTWVIAAGDARARAREAFAHPFGRPPLDLDASALAVVRVDGPSLVARWPLLQDLGGLASLGRHLRSVTLALPPGVEGSLTATLAYADEDSAALAEVTSREVLGALKRRGPGPLAWLVPTRVARPDKKVILTVPLPPSLVDALIHAGGVQLPAAVDLPPPGP
jgi:hypothetical protein